MANQEWREIVARQLWTARYYDAHTEYENNRDVAAYVKDLSGVAHYLGHLKSHRGQLGSNLVLDVGAGTTRGISQLTRMPWSADLTFRATILKLLPSVAVHLGREAVSITPVERLAGICDTSVAGVLSVYGLAYSKQPELAVASVDRVLVPGGTVKASFYDERFQSSRMHPDIPDAFAEELRRRAYDVFVSPHKGFAVLLAVKHPGTGMSAEQLMLADEYTFEDQFALAQQAVSQHISF